MLIRIKNFPLCQIAIAIFVAFPANGQVLGPEHAFDEWTGLYLSQDKKMAAKVIKKLVKQADLFSPAEYSYNLDLVDNKKPFVKAKHQLNIDPAQNLLYGSDIGDCDDPGCTYFNSETSLYFNSSKNLPELAITYEWYTFPDEDTEADSGNGERLALRAFSGIEILLPTREPMANASLKELVISSLEKNAKQVSLYDDFVLMTELENTKMDLYKKALKTNNELSALFVVTPIEYKDRYGIKSGECATLLSKVKKNWKAVHTECVTGTFNEEMPF